MREIEEHFMLIKEAYDVLSCKDQKKAFDESIQNKQAKEWCTASDFVFEKSNNPQLDSLIQEMMREKQENDFKKRQETEAR
jgi:curved DNA-binding protein CbpA